MVLGFHAYGFDQKFLSHPALPDLFTFGQTGLDLFFVVSGFVMAMTTAARKGFADSAGFLLERVFRIFSTYWIYFFALVAVQLLLPSMINKSGGCHRSEPEFPVLGPWGFQFRGRRSSSLPPCSASWMARM